MSRLRWFSIIIVFTLVGCAGDGKVQPVSGTVFFEGQLLDQGNLTFLGEDGPVGGALVRDGKFAVPAEFGLPPGTYRVSISSAGPGGVRTPEQVAAGASTPGRERIPVKYNTETTLTADVTSSGSNHFEFRLE